MDPEIKAELDSLKSTVSDLNKRVDALTSALDKTDETLSAVETKFDALNGKIEANERTIGAIGDALKTADLGAVADLNLVVVAIRDRVNAFHYKVFQEPLFDTSAPIDPT